MGYRTTRRQIKRAQAVKNGDLESLRAVETAWLVRELSLSIANLPIAVGLGVAPNPKKMKVAATKLFDRYARMIQMARSAGDR